MNSRLAFAPRAVLPVLAGLLSGLLALAASGCGGSAPSPRPDGTNGPRPDRVGDPAVIHWTTPVLYHGVEVRLEIAAGASERAARIEGTDLGDRLRSGDLELVYRYRRFETPGGGRHHFEDGSRVFVFQPPAPDTPWEARIGDELALVWIGDGVSPVVREDRRDGSVEWTFGRARVTRSADGAIEYRHRDDRRTLSPPVTVLLDAAGKIAETRPRVR